MKKLALVTLFYIATPTLLFLLIWLKPTISFLAVSGLVTSFFIACRYLSGYQEHIKNAQLNAVLLSSSVLSLILCLMSEFGAVNYESYDYQAHNFKLHLLATEHLPLYSEARDIYMCYYLGFYIIPSLLGKYLSIKLISAFFFIFCWIGLGLSFAWIQLHFVHLAHFKRILICLGLLIGSYVCVIFPALSRIFPDLPIESSNAMIINGKFVLNQIPALTRGLSESPQHTLPAILGICFLLAVRDKPAFFYALSLFLLSTLFLTPFAAIGLVPFILTIFLNNLSNEGTAFLRKMLLFLIPLLLAFLPVILFLTSSEATTMKSNRIIWQAGSPLWPVYYLIYLFTAYGVWFLFFGRQLLLLGRSTIYVSVLFVSIVSLFQVGFYNDLHIRSTIVPQMVFGLSIAYVVVTRFKLILKRRILTIGFLFWCINAVSPVKFFYDRIFVFHGKLNSISDPRVAGFTGDYYDLLENAYKANGKEVVKQYSMRKGTIFEKYLLKKRKI